MKLLSVGLRGTADEIRARMQQDCAVLNHEGFRIAIDETSRGNYTFLGCNISEGEMSFRNYERIKRLLKRLIAKIVAEVIVIREEKKLVRKIIDQEYHYFSKNEQGMIYDHVVCTLNSNAVPLEGFTLPDRIGNVLGIVMNYLDNQHELVLDGFVNFRLKEYRSKLRETVDLVVDDFMLEMEYREFIRVLQSFIGLQDPLAEEVHVLIDSSGKFKILDIGGQIVSNSYVDHMIADSRTELNYEDLLITSLIAVAPVHVVIHNISYPGEFMAVVETIRNIFEGRVIICKGCEICNFSI